MISARISAVTIFRVHRQTELNSLDTNTIPIDKISPKLARLMKNSDAFRVFEDYESLQLLNANLSQFEFAA